MSIIKIRDNEGNLQEILAIKGEPGKSAYELAHENGFEGDVDAWLESLNHELTAEDKDEIVNEVSRNHTHSYAGSDSVGGPANSVVNSLTIQLNNGSVDDVSKFTFNGSTSKTINITPGRIGAATSGHSHDDKYPTWDDVGNDDDCLVAPRWHIHENLGSIYSEAGHTHDNYAEIGHNHDTVGMKVVALSADPSRTGERYAGYGACIVMYDDSNCFVFDVGNDWPEYGKTLYDYLIHEDITTINALFISHNHSDHFHELALRRLVTGNDGEDRKIQVDYLVAPHASYTSTNWETEKWEFFKNLNMNDTSAEIRYWNSTAQEYQHLSLADYNSTFGCNIKGILAPTTEGSLPGFPTDYDIGKFNITCHNVSSDYLDSYEEWKYSDFGIGSTMPNYNNWSMVNVVTYDGKKIVVTGDIMAPAIENMFNDGVFDNADLIFVPHHGLDMDIPHCISNRLTAKHAVIPSAYDTYTDASTGNRTWQNTLISVSRPFAGELLKKGCRVTTTNVPNGGDPNNASYIVNNSGVHVVDPGALAGNELSPRGIKQGQNLDTLTEGEYVTYSEDIAASVTNGPGFIVTHKDGTTTVKKFRVKVENNYTSAISTTDSRTQIAYTVDTSMTPGIAIRTYYSYKDTDGKYVRNYTPWRKL